MDGTRNRGVSSAADRTIRRESAELMNSFDAFWSTDVLICVNAPSPEPPGDCASLAIVDRATWTGSSATSENSRERTHRPLTRSTKRRGHKAIAFVSNGAGRMPAARASDGRIVGAHNDDARRLGSAPPRPLTQPTGAPPSLRTDARTGARCHPGATPSPNKNGLPEGKPLSCLVAGEGFEPSTFGL